MKHHAILTIVSTFLMSACQKPVKADFSTDKPAYLAGEIVKLTNHSADAASYKWTLPNGQTSTALNPEYKINADLDNGVLNFKLETFSKNGKRSSVCLRAVSFQPSGQATIWATGYGGIQHDVYVDNILLGSVKTSYDPVLGNYPPGHVSGRFSLGVHYIEVKAVNSITQSGSMYISKGDSLEVRI